MANTLFDKIWDAHVVQKVEDGPTQLYIDRLYCHEVTSPQAFAGMRARGLKCFRPERIYCMPDHNTPTQAHRGSGFEGASGCIGKECRRFRIDSLRYDGQAERDYSRGGSRTGTDIARHDDCLRRFAYFYTRCDGSGCLRYRHQRGGNGNGFAMYLECILQARPKTMRITIDGKLGKGVTAKDVALYMMSKMTTSGATGYFVEYAGEAIRSLTMEGRLTLCNLSIEMGARGGMIAPDEVTFEYIKGREYAPKGADWDKAVAYWKTLKSDEDAVFDKEVRYDAADIQPMITYGTNPGMGMAITAHIPVTEGMSDVEKASFEKSLHYMGFQPGP